MPDYNIQVKVDPNQAVAGTKKVKNGLNEIEDQANKTRTAIKRAFQTIGVAVVIRELYKTADAYTNLQNRLRVVTSGTKELAEVTDELYAISQRTRSSFQNSAELYARVALATKEMNVETQQLTQFTESLNQAIILSGASAVEANAGLIQLSQGIASNTLRGDELRSVLEQLPAVADVIARSMGITRGQLRTVAAEGKITAEVILNAFKEARGELADRFATTVPTLGQSFQVLRNSFTKMIGSFDDGIGVSRMLSKVIIGLSLHMETIVRGATALAFTLGTVLATQAIPKAIAAFKALTIAMAANPIGFIAVALTTTISLLIAFSDKIMVGTGSLANLQDIAVATWEQMTKSVTKFVEYFKANFGGLFDIVTKLFNKIEFSLGGFIKLAAKAVDIYIGIWRSAYFVIIAFWKNFPKAFKETVILAINGGIKIVETGVNGILGLFNKLFESVGLAGQFTEVAFAGIENTAEGAAANLGNSLGDAIKQGMAFSGVSQFADGILKRAEEIAVERKKIADAAANAETKKKGVAAAAPDTLFATILASLKQEGDLLKLNNAEREIQAGILKAEKKLKKDLTETQRGLIEAQLRQNQALQVQAALYEQIRGPITEYKMTLQGLNDLLEQGRINQQEFNQALSETQLATDLTSLKSDLGSPEEQKTMALQEQLAQRQMIIDQAQEAKLISEQEALNLSLEANKSYHSAIMQNTMQRYQLELGATSNAFGALASAAEAYGGKQSKTYKRLFAMSKAFAIAQSTVAIVQGIAKSAELGWPANIAAIASTIAMTAGLVSQIQSVQYAGGFKTGGDFKVGGQGGSDSQMVAFRATPNEQVSVRTPAQQREGGGGSTTVSSPPVNIINVPDMSMVADYLNTPEGETVLLNSINNNREAITATLQQ